jgi:hypothetical protein
MSVESYFNNRKKKIANLFDVGFGGLVEQGLNMFADIVLKGVGALADKFKSLAMAVLTPVGNFFSSIGQSVSSWIERMTRTVMAGLSTLPLIGDFFKGVLNKEAANKGAVDKKNADTKNAWMYSAGIDNLAKKAVDSGQQSFSRSAADERYKTYGTAGQGQSVVNAPITIIAPKGVSAEAVGAAVKRHVDAASSQANRNKNGGKR